MRKAVSVAVATAIATSGFGLVIASSASAAVSVADGKECTQAEYQNVHKGDSKTRVDRIIGSKGLLNSGGATTSGYLYGGLPVGDITPAGCLITFKQAHGDKSVVSKDGWFPRS
jgi:hypothetical protein